jgi:hypothetical protein
MLLFSHSRFDDACQGWYSSMAAAKEEYIAFGIPFENRIISLQ